MTDPRYDAVVRLMMDHTRFLLAMLDRDLRFVFVNRAYAEADGKEADWFVGKRHFDLYPSAENERIFEEVVATGVPYAALAKAFVYERNLERGVSYWDWWLVPVRDDSGQVVGLLLNLLNVTERVTAIHEAVAAAKRLELLLAQRDLLLRELQHRVRNNLQVVTSLLGLQAAQATSQEVRAHLEAGRLRVTAIAMGDDVSSRESGFDLPTYVELLVTGILGTVGVRPGISVELRVEPLPLVPAQIAPSGLILNELVTNALVHGFQGRRAGRVLVSGRATADGAWVELVVEDDGIGVPEQARRGFGLELVRSMADQIGAQVEVAVGGGTRAVLRLPRR